MSPWLVPPAGHRSIDPGAVAGAPGSRSPGLPGGKDSETCCRFPAEGLSGVDLPRRRDVGHTEPELLGEVHPREPGLVSVKFRFSRFVVRGVSSG